MPLRTTDFFVLAQEKKNWSYVMEFFYFRCFKNRCSSISSCFFTSCTFFWVLLLRALFVLWLICALFFSTTTRCSSKCARFFNCVFEAQDAHVIVPSREGWHLVQLREVPTMREVHLMPEGPIVVRVDDISININSSSNTTTIDVSTKSINATSIITSSINTASISSNNYINSNIRNTTTITFNSTKFILLKVIVVDSQYF